MTTQTDKTSIHSMLCREQDFSKHWFNIWCRRIADGSPELEPEKRAVWGSMRDNKTKHLKLWEWCAISQALEERGMLSFDRKGIGFAVGHEPLPSLFSALGTELVASDFYDETANQVWALTGQLGDPITNTHWRGLLPFKDFSSRVTYQKIDMRDLSHLPDESYDFS